MPFVDRLRASSLPLVAAFGLAWAGLAAAAPLYSDHPAATAKTKRVPFFIDPSFAVLDRDQILSAVEEWNRALNGVVRLERAAGANDAVEGTKPWVIRRSAGRDGIREPGRKDENLGTVQPLPMGGGVLLIFSGADDYLRTHSLTLRDVMMRELGHVVGLRHTDQAELLGEDYRAGDRSCVDRQTAQEVARLFAVPLEALNWCEAPGR